jgi:hypothetical protein
MPTGFQKLRQLLLGEPDYSKGEPLSYGELGTLPRVGGGFSTELMTGISDPRLYGGRETNIPLLSQGQEDVGGLLQGNAPTRGQYERAIQRATERVSQGQQFPNFATPVEADAGAQRRHRMLERLIQQRGVQ